MKRGIAAAMALLMIMMCAMSALAESAVVTKNTRVYKKASKSSASASVKKGTKVELLATKGSWALIERSGVRAYISKSALAIEEDEPDYDSLMKDAVPARINTTTRVYKQPSASGKSMKVSKGASVNLLATSGSWALIERNGAYAYIKAKYVTEIMDGTVPTVAYINDDVRVYKKASTSSASLKVSKGMKVSLLETSGIWALIQNGSARAYIQKEYLSNSPVESNAPDFPVKPAVTPTPSPTPTPTPTAKPTATPKPENYFESDKYSNEEKCYLFLVHDMGLNSAAACGIMANIRKESNFNPTAGSSYYGLIQWGGGRKTNLKNFCAEKGYGYDTLEGQLNFLEHELTEGYPKLVKLLKSVPNTGDGAYDAAYRFCYDYERPSNKASKSASRGELARDTYFPKYAEK